SSHGYGVLDIESSWFLVKCKHGYVISSLMDMAYRMSEEENVCFDLVRCDLCPSSIKEGTAKGVDLRVVNSYTGNHHEDDFTPLETIRRFVGIELLRSINIPFQSFRAVQAHEICCNVQSARRSGPSIPKAITKPSTHIEGWKEMDFMSFMMEGVNGEFHFEPEGGVGDEEEGKKDEVILVGRTIADKAKNQKESTSSNVTRKRKQTVESPGRESNVDSDPDIPGKFLTPHAPWTLRIVIGCCSCDSTFVEARPQRDNLGKTLRYPRQGLGKGRKRRTMPTLNLRRSKEFDQAGDNLATASYPFQAEAIADPYAPLEVLLSKKSKSLHAKPAPLKSSPSSSKSLDPSS
nr:hypothetical protein [Tanacetum cinerariifolium]